MNGRKNGCCKKIFAAILSLTLAAGAVLVPPAGGTQAAVTYADFYGESIAPGAVDWNFRSNFKKSMVYKNGKLDTDKVAHGNFINESTAENYVKTKAGADVRTAAQTSIVTGLSAAVPANKPYVIYRSVGTVEQNGELITLDMKVTLTGWEIASGTASGDAFVQFATCVVDASGEDYPHDEAAIGVWPSANVRSIGLQYDFYKAGTNTKVPISGTFSLVDLDYRQYFKIDENSNIQYVQKAADDYASAEKDAKDGLVRPLVRGWYDKASHITMETSGSTVKVKASAAGTTPQDVVSITDTGGTIRTKEIAGSYLSGYVTFTFKNQSTIGFTFGSDGGVTANAASLGHYYYGILPYSVGSCEAPTPAKFVVKDGCALTDDGALTSEMTLNTGNRAVTYVSCVYVPRSIDTACNYKSFQLADTLNGVYEAAADSTVTIYQDSLDGNVVTSWFQNVSSGQTVKYKAYASTISETGRDFFGHYYYFVIETRIREALSASDFTKAGATKGSDGLYKIPNTVTCTAKVYDPYDLTSEDVSRTSDTVYVKYAQPALSLTKQVKAADAADSAYDAEATVTVGSKVHYQVVLTQDTSGAAATNVSFTDKVPGRLTVDASSVKAYLTQNGSAVATLTTARSAYGQVTAADNRISVGFDFSGAYTSSGSTYANYLGSGYKVTLEYDATAANKIGTIVGAVNTAAAAADNGLEAYASAAVYTAAEPVDYHSSVELTKEADKSEVAVGDTVTYTVTATNTGDDELVPFTLSDDTMPSGFSLDSVKVERYGDLNGSYTWYTVYSGDDGVSITADKNAWEVAAPDEMCDGIGNGEKLRVTAVYTAGISADGDITYGSSVTNTATIKGAGYRSGESVSAEASAVTRITAPQLQITKTSDKDVYALGDTAYYTITITQTANAVASGIVLTDVFDKDTTDSLGYNLYDKRTATNDVCAVRGMLNYDTNGEVYSEYKTESYTDSGGLAGYKTAFEGSLAQNESYTVTYRVNLVDDALVEQANNPGAVTNTVTVSASNASSAAAEKTVQVVKPELSITKTADKPSCEAGETVTYSVDVSNTVSGTSVADPVVSDTVPSDLTLDAGSAALTVYDSEGQEVTSGDYTLSVSKDTWEVYGDTLDCGYTLHITYEAKALASGAGKSVTNTATAEGDNADEVSAAATIKITETEPTPTPAWTTIRVEKRILASDINFANGDPIFVINLTGTDENGNAIGKHEVVRFTEAYVKENTGADGYVSITAVFDKLPPGDYEVSEDAALRYRLQSVNGEEGAAGCGFVNTGANGSDEYSAVFVNEKYEWQYYSETDHVVNSFHTAAE